MTTENNVFTIADLIIGRRTIHEFKPESVDIEKIKQAIDVARWAPNHYLTEPWHVYLLGKETINAIIELNTRLVRSNNGDEAAQAKKERWSGIPGWMVITCDKSSDNLRQQEDYAACCCMVQNILLCLWNENIGVKWSTGTITRDDRFYDLLWIDPSAEVVIGMFWYGYAAEIPAMTRKHLEQTLVELP